MKNKNNDNGMVELIAVTYGITLSIKDACDLLGIGRSTIEKLIRNEGLPVKKIAGQYRISTVELVDWWNRQACNASRDLLMAGVKAC